MSLRKKYADRCARCLMRQELCLCSEIPVLPLQTKLLVIGTKREMKIPTNTGRLATLALPHSEILIFGERDQPLLIGDRLTPGHRHLLLYPDENAPILSSEWLEEHPGPYTLCVPDGNWRQTSKMGRRHPELSQLQRIRLAPGAPSGYRVRKETKAEGLATIEAIARAFEILEGPAVRQALDELFEKMVRRTLQSRGTLSVLDQVK